MKYDIVHSNGEVSSQSFENIISENSKTLLFFYPRDNTPGCTTENRDFSCLKKEFKDIGIALLGVSKDSVESHKKFISDHVLDFSLISDPELKLHETFGAFGEKNNYGKIVQGVIRSTFLLSQTGEILQEWRNVRAKGHAEKVLREISK